VAKGRDATQRRRIDVTFSNSGASASLNVKLWRGERMCLIGMDVAAPEDDFVGFAIEVKSPGSPDYIPIRNRLNFDYADAASKGVDGFRNYLSTTAPFQKFRWIHFPYDPRDGAYLYRVTKMHMNAAGALRGGDQVADLPITLDRVTYDNYLEVGFTRNFASSQAYADKFGNNPDVIPADPAEGCRSRSCRAMSTVGSDLRLTNSSSAFWTKSPTTINSRSTVLPTTSTSRTSGPARSLRRTRPSYHR
jgi:hypothetical protein